MSRNRSTHLLGFALDHPWALTPGMLRVVAGILGDHLAGKAADPETIEAAVAARRPDGPQQLRRGGVAVIPVSGVIAPRANLLTETSGGTSFEALTRATREAVAHPDVKTIVYDVDSPGGSAAGAAEFATEVRAARAKKAIVAVANHQMASAAYWVFANATKVHASPSALVGSVGVYTIHNDLSDALAQLGIKREYLSVGKYKIEGNETGPLSDEARAYRMGLIQQTYDHFIGDVAKGRGVPAAPGRDSYGQGRLLTADDALAAGMIDAVATLDETLARLLPDGVPATEIAPSARASTSQEPLPATDQETHEPSTTQRAALAAALLSWDLTDLERSCAL